MKELPGVQITDMGVKFGQNGVDNAALKFSNVRIPRENMLNKFTDVDESGNFYSKFKTPAQRFFGVTEKLLSGRICIASMCTGASRACLYIAIKYAQQRMAVGPTGESDTPIFQYQLQQNALIPLLARTICLGLMHNKCKDIYQNGGIGYKDELLSLCCIDKTMNGWNLERVASICRERCGGQGYLSNNKFGDYLACAHASLTAEGDNRVLMVKICKDMITNVTKKGHKLPEMSQCPFRGIAKMQDVTGLGALLDILKFREVTLYTQLIEKQKELAHLGGYQVLMRETSEVMQNLAMAYGERHTLEHCINTLSKLSCPKNKEVMTRVFTLFGCELVFRDTGFYMIQGIISAQAAIHLDKERIMLIKSVALDVDDLLDCMNIAKHALYAPIAQDYVKYNSVPNFGEVIGAKM
jgi:acyl-CoA oxidase